MFEWDEEGQRLVAMHHPFTAPNPADVGGAGGGEGDLRTARALAYDLVLNGTEIGGVEPRLSCAPASLGLLRLSLCRLSS